MSADVFAVFYGIKKVVKTGESTSLEEWVKRICKEHGLQYYWEEFVGPPKNEFVLVGRKIGLFGVENQHQQQVGAGELQRIAGDTMTRLQAAGVMEEPSLILQWVPDV